MSTMLMDKKRNGIATIIVAKARKAEPMMDMPMPEMKEEVPMDHIKLAAYELCEAAGLKIENMDKFIEAWKMLHMYVHDYEDESYGSPGMDY